MIARLLALLLMAGLPVEGPATELPAAVQDEQATTVPVGDERIAQRQILMMLRATPPHYRPDGVYGGGYQAAPDRQARRRIARALAEEYGLRLVDDWPMPALGLDCFVLEAPSHEAGAHALQALSGDARVESVQSMQLFHVLGSDDPLAPAQPATSNWHLRELHAVTTGKRVTVAELDTGVDTTHPDLRGQILLARNFVDDAAVPAESHGTQVAGIIAARSGDGIGIAGIAPDARLLALRACWQRSVAASESVCSSFTLAKALQFALQRRAQVFNLSLSGPPDPLLGRLLDVALSEGVIVVGAVDAQAKDGGFPAGHAGVFAIAGSSLRNDRAPGALLAPERGIPAPNPGGGWSLVSGPSFAAAQVSGLVALLRELAPGLDRAQIRAALTPPELGLPARRPALIDACAAVVRVAQRCACDCAATQTIGPVPRR